MSSHKSKLDFVISGWHVYRGGGGGGGICQEQTRPCEACLQHVGGGGGGWKFVISGWHACMMLHSCQLWERPCLQIKIDHKNKILNLVRELEARQLA